MTTGCDTHSRFFAGATVSLGPSNDSPQFAPALLTSAIFGVRWDRVLADAAFDSEAHHRFARDGLGVRATVIPVFRRGGGAGPVGGAYRNQMVRRFRPKPEGSRHKWVYGQRWQARERVQSAQAEARQRAPRALRREPHPRVLPPGTHAGYHAPPRP